MIAPLTYWMQQVLLAPLIVQITILTITPFFLGGGGGCVKVCGAEGAAGAVMRRAGVGPQDAVQHAGAEPSV